MNIDNEIQRFTQVLSRLTTSKSIKYCDWNPSAYSDELKGIIGIYHFFEESNIGIKSLYVGKAGFGDSGDWDLYERLKQHFQTSQKYTFLGKFAASESLSRIEAKSQLMESKVKFQWIAIEPTENSDEELMRVECFCKAILNPHYTDE